MHQLRPYNQQVLDATQAAARAITIAVFLCIGIANYAVFGTKLQVRWFTLGGKLCCCRCGCMCSCTGSRNEERAAG